MITLAVTAIQGYWLASSSPAALLSLGQASERDNVLVHFKGLHDSSGASLTYVLMWRTIHETPHLRK
jgi:hypothetical protein